MDNRPEMGGATAHPTGATLALGDPSVSLNAWGGGLESGHQQEAIPVLDLREVGAWLALGHVAGASAVNFLFIELDHYKDHTSAPVEVSALQGGISLKSDYGAAYD